MSVRGVWIIRSASKEPPGRPKVLFSRKYPTVERRAKIVSPKLYHPIPGDSELAQAVQLKCTESTQKFVEERDGCSLNYQYPVFELLGGHLWPVVAIEKDKLLYVSVPLVECNSDERPPLIAIPSISCTVSLLESMITIMDTDKELDESSPKFQELYQFLCVCAPFGSPIDCSIANIKTQLQLSKTKPSPNPKQKQPSWRPSGVKGGARLQLNIKEEIRAVQYDKIDVSDCWDVFGTVHCKAEIDGHPDILLTLTVPPDTPALDHLIVHPCVQSVDAQPASHNGTDFKNRKIRFSAPTDSFILCHYQASAVPFLPVRGYYQMKGDNKTIKMLVQLKLNEAVKNNFEYFEVHIPFLNRCAIEKVDNIVPVTATPSLALSQDRKVIMWTIGQKFPGKTLELSLQATVHFYDAPVPPSDDDPFCVGLNAYIDLYFKLMDYTISSCNIDNKSITLFPAAKYRLTISRECFSSQYRIWNSHGEVIAAQQQLKHRQ